MKLIPYLTKGIRVYREESSMLIISFLIFPMVLSFLYGGMQKNLFEGKYNTVDNIEVDFHYDKKSDKGIVLSEILSNEKVEEVIHIGGKNSKYHVIISKDFKRF